MIEDFLWWVAEKKFVCVCFCVCVCLCVCSSILAPGARTTGPIGTGGGSFDAPERRKDDGDNRGVIGTTLHVPRAAA